MKKVIVVFIVVIFLSLGIALFADCKITLDSVKLIEFDENANEIIIEIKKENNLLLNTFSCIITSGNNNIFVTGKDNTCRVKLPIGSNYSFVLKKDFIKTKNYQITDYIDNRLSFNFLNDIIYLTIGESKTISFTEKNISSKGADYDFFIDDNDIASLENNIITGISKGETILHEKKSDKVVKIIVTDLITKPTISSSRKSILPCNRYSEEENKLLDEFLKNDVELAGYKTRAGAVAAARFLTLKLKYRIPYFYENGRVSDSGTNYVDGEGRYYHTGLYLSDTKKNDIVASFNGPVIWGCPLRNWENEPFFGYIEGNLMPNGLDCSGFVTWSLVNGGFDPGDRGAGQMTELGEFVKLNDEVMNSNIIKAGDLFNYWGHISIIVGIKDGIYYVAESLPNYDGVDLRVYNKEEVLDMFRYVVLMDSFYKDDGNYLEFWD